MNEARVVPPEGLWNRAVDNCSCIGEEDEEEDSIGTSTHLRNAVFVPPGGPVFASVEALQQETLQHRAATGVC